LRIYHDWEFLENGATNSVKPISVGMVTEDGHELYCEFFQAPWSDIYKHEWLKANVVPALHPGINAAIVAGVGNGIVKSNIAICNKVYNFLRDAFNRDPNNLISLWGWYSSYDHVCLGQLFGSMIELPDIIPMWTNDIKQEVMRLGNPLIPNMRLPGETVHNALDDARAEKRMHEWLINYENVDSFDSEPIWEIMGFESKQEMRKFEERSDFPGWDAL
jgi:3' exoribonuclease, RNase T-like